jgi:uncharacterized membrane protein YeiH
MQPVLEHFGVSVGAITGVLAARGKQVDLFGVIVLALVTALGGGTLRDLLIDCPVFWTLDQSFLINATTTAVISFYLVRIRELPRSVLLVADAFALALFTVLGTRKGLHFHLTPAIAVTMGVITGVAGGVLRDVLVGEIPLVFRREIYLYATAAFVGALICVLLAAVEVAAAWSFLGGFSATLLLRLAGIKWRMSLPIFRPKTVDLGP